MIDNLQDNESLKVSPPEITEKDMIDFVAQRASDEIDAAIRKLFEDPQSYPSQFVKELGEKAKRAFDIDWRALADM